MYFKEEFFGKDIIEKYCGIVSIIDLIAYRASINNLGGLFSNDAYDNKTTLLTNVALHFRLMIEKLVCVGRIPKRKTDKVLVSDSFWGSDRYKDLRDALVESGSVFGVLQAKSVSFRPVSLHINRKINRIRKICFGKSICGNVLKRDAINLFDFIHAAMNDEKGWNTEELELLIKKLNNSVNCRRKIIEKVLRRNNVKLFLTTNEYNLSDRLIMLACKQVGILTKELAHCSELILDVNYSSDFNNSLFIKDTSLNYVDERCLWSEYEISYCKKYLTKDIKYSNVGCPEIYNKPQIAKENVLTLMVPTKTQIRELTAFNDYDLKIDEFEYKSKLFEKVAVFAEKNSLSVLVRYHPFDDTDTLQQDKKMCEKKGFSILAGDRAAFDDAVIRSRVVIGFESTSLVIAAFMNCIVYNVSDKVFDYCGFPIKTIIIDDLAHEIINEDYEFNYPCEINVKKLLSCS